MSYSCHIRDIVSSASSRMNRLLRAFRNRPNSFKIQLYKVFVRPLLESCTSIWSPKTAIHSKLIESVQKKLLLYRLNSKYHFINFRNMKGRYVKQLSDFNLVTLSRRRTIFDLCQLYKIIHKLSDTPYLAKQFIYNSRVGRQSKLLVIGSHTALRHTHFTIRTIRLWNTLPTTVTQADTLRKFRIGANGFFDSDHIM